MPQKRLEFVDKLGGNVAAYIRRARLPANLFDDPDTWVYYQSYLKLIHDIAKREGIPDLTFAISDMNIKEAVVPAVTLRLCSAPTLAEALRRVNYWGQYQQTGLRVDTFVSNDTASVSLRLPASVETPGFSASETGSMLLLLDLCRVYLGNGFKPAMLKLMSRSQDVSYEIEDAYGGVRVQLDSSVSEIRFPKHLLASVSPFLSSSKEVFPQAPAPLSSPPSKVSDKVKALLDGYLPDGAPTLAEMSEILGVSQRTLQRLLAREDVTYFQVVDEARCSRALQYLSDCDSNACIDDIAHRVGYSERSPFIRSFKRWTSMTPAVYRESRTVKHTP
jgi:AraC-like DNA-binding protein